MTNMELRERVCSLYDFMADTMQLCVPGDTFNDLI